MDIIKFQKGIEFFPPNDNYPVDVVEIFVNGQNLLELVKQCELPYATANHEAYLAGRYAGLPISDFIFNMNEVFNQEEERIYIYDCICGCIGCWPLEIKMIITDTAIIWTDFENEHREDWYWNKLGFIFGKEQFMTEFNKLKSW